MFRILCFTAFFTLFSIISCAQKLKKKVELNGKLKEVYHIDKKTKFKQGRSFCVWMESKDTLAIGDYHNESRIGMWRFKDRKSGANYLDYDYESDSIVYLNKSIVADSFLVKTDKGYEVAKVDRPALYIGHKEEICLLLSRVLSIDEMRKGLVGLAVINYRIDKEGNLLGAKVVNSIDKQIEIKVDRQMKSLPGKFLPAIRNGEAIESAIFVRLNVQNLNRQNTPMKFPQASYIYDVAIAYGSETRIVSSTRSMVVSSSSTRR